LRRASAKHESLRQIAAFDSKYLGDTRAMKIS
jgi:hypothetical protein